VSYPKIKAQPEGFDCYFVIVVIIMVVVVVTSFAIVLNQPRALTAD
jgi:t-SNARE complex subunit (syntaxin)